jgi:hypothetical protein
MADTPSAASNSLLEKQKELLESIKNISNDAKLTDDERAKQLEVINLALESINEKIRNSVEVSKLRLKAISDELRIIQSIEESNVNLLQSDKENLEISKQRLIIDQLIQEKIEYIQKAKKNNIVLDEEEVKIKDILIQKEEDNLKKLESRKNATDSMAKNLADKLGIKAEKGSIFDLLTDEQGDINFIKKKDIILDFAKKFEEKYLQPQEIGASILQKVYASTYEGVILLDSQRAALNRATGAIIGYTSELNNTANVVAINGVSAEAAGNAMISLAKNFSNFNETSSRTRVELASTIANLSALGINSDLAAKNMSTLVQSFGMSTEKAMATSKELAVLANSLGTSPERIATDFAAAASTLVVYGDKGIEVFRGLEAAAKASGLEVSNLLGIVKKMDTFQGAAESAGKLNAILGGGLLNSSELLMASEEQRIRLVVEAVQTQGVQFKDLDKYTQMSIANAAGITDMAQANKLFGMSLSEYDKYTIQAEKSKDVTSKLDFMVQSASTSFDKLKVAGQQMAIFLTPLVFIFSALVDGFVMGVSSINFFIEAIKSGYSYIGDFFKQFEPIRKIFNFIAEYIPIVDILAITFKFLATSIGLVVGMLVAARVASIAYNAVLFISKLATDGVIIAAYARIVAERILGAQLMATRIGQLLATSATIAATAATWLFATAVSALNLIMSMNPIGLAVIAIAALIGVVAAAIKNFDTWGKVTLALLGPIGWLIIGLKMAYDMFVKKGSPEFYKMAEVVANGFTKWADAIVYVVKQIAAALNPFQIFTSLVRSAANALSLFFDSGDVNKNINLKQTAETTEKVSKSANSITPEVVKKTSALTENLEQMVADLNKASILLQIEPLNKLALEFQKQKQEFEKDIPAKVILDDRVIGDFIIKKIINSGALRTIIKPATPANVS